MKFEDIVRTFGDQPWFDFEMAHLVSGEAAPCVHTELYRWRQAGKLVELRRGFFTLAEQEFRVLKRTGRKACLVYIDLDGLKAINDSQGHETGDTYIRAAAEVLRGCFRESDIIARVGGDEFVVFPINADCESTLIIDRLKNCIESFRVKKGLPALSMSTGIGHYNPQSPMTLEDLLKESDRAMYAEKERKRRK